MKTILIGGRATGMSVMVEALSRQPEMIVIQDEATDFDWEREREEVMLLRNYALSLDDSFEIAATVYYSSFIRHPHDNHSTRQHCQKRAYYRPHHSIINQRFPSSKHRRVPRRS